MTDLPAQVKAALGGATPGPCRWWASNSWRRLYANDMQFDVPVLTPYVCRDGHPDCSIETPNADLIALAPDLAVAYLNMVEALEACEAEIDDYIRQEYPFDDPVNTRRRERDMSANPARIALDAYRQAREDV